MNTPQAIAEQRAIHKAIMRNHPFFRHSGYQAFGYDWQTFRSLYPVAARILRHAINVSQEAR